MIKTPDFARKDLAIFATVFTLLGALIGHGLKGLTETSIFSLSIGNILLLLLGGLLGVVVCQLIDKYFRLKFGLYGWIPWFGILLSTIAFYFLF